MNLVNLQMENAEVQTEVWKREDIGVSALLTYWPQMCICVEALYECRYHDALQNKSVARPITVRRPTVQALGSWFSCDSDADASVVIALP